MNEENRCNNCNSLKGEKLMSDHEILTKFLKYSDEEARTILLNLKLKDQIKFEEPRLKKDFETEFKEEILEEVNKFTDSEYEIKDLHISIEAI